MTGDPNFAQNLPNEARISNNNAAFFTIPFQSAWKHGHRTGGDPQPVQHC